MTDSEGNACAQAYTCVQAMGTPWRKIITSGPVWAIIIAHTCSNWGGYTLLTNIPTYMAEVLKFDIKAVSVIITVVVPIIMIITIIIIHSTVHYLQVVFFFILVEAAAL